MLSVRLKGSFSLSHLTAFSTNIKKMRTKEGIHTLTHFTEVVCTGRTIPSDVCMTVNLLNNTENCSNVLFLTVTEKQMSGKEQTDIKE